MGIKMAARASDIESYFRREAAKKIPTKHKIDVWCTGIIVYLLLSDISYVTKIVQGIFQINVPYELLLHGPVSFDANATREYRPLICNPHFPTFFNNPSYLTNEFITLTKVKSDAFLALPEVHETLEGMLEWSHEEHRNETNRTQRGAHTMPTSRLHRKYNHRGKVGYRKYIQTIANVTQSVHDHNEAVSQEHEEEDNLTSILLAFLPSQLCEVQSTGTKHRNCISYRKIEKDCLPGGKCGTNPNICWWHNINLPFMMAYVNMGVQSLSRIVMAALLFDPPPARTRWFVKPITVVIFEATSILVMISYLIVLNSQANALANHSILYETYEDYYYGLNTVSLEVYNIVNNLAVALVFLYLQIFTPSYPRVTERLETRRLRLKIRIETFRERAFKERNILKHVSLRARILSLQTTSLPLIPSMLKPSQ